jgi:hypothetical protein
MSENLHGFSAGGKSAVSIILAGFAVISTTLVALGALGLLNLGPKAHGSSGGIEQKVDRIEQRLQDLAIDVAVIKSRLPAPEHRR